MLGKEEFDCNLIGDFYDCGCGHDDEGEEKRDGTPEKESARVEINDEP